jgi:hypothetical protein
MEVFRLPTQVEIDRHVASGLPPDLTVVQQRIKDIIFVYAISAFMS